jgi:hypothetical protein
MIIVCRWLLDALLIFTIVRAFIVIRVEILALRWSGLQLFGFLGAICFDLSL